MVQLKGIDVSRHNGNVDWDKVKTDGIQFAILRCGTGATNDDTQFERNVKECERVGIPWGTYIYSYALNIDQAKAEVEHVRRLLKGKKPTYPIAFDMEDADGYKRKNGMPSNQVLVDICDTFLSAFTNDYHVVLYASLSWLNNQLNHPKLDKYDKWVAQWNTTCTYKKPFSLWQYSETGKVNGIKGNVDMDISYVDYAQVQKEKEQPKQESKQLICPVWDGMELRKGQIGRITVLKDINLWKDGENGKLEEVRVLKPGEIYRVYGKRDDYFGQFDVGNFYWVTNMPEHIKYETPSTAKLQQASEYYAALSK